MDNAERNISKITERVISNTENLLTCRKEIISPHDIPTLKKKIKDAEEKLEVYEKKWFQSFYKEQKTELRNSISDLEIKLEKKQRIAILEEAIKKDKKLLLEISVTSGSPVKLNGDVVTKHLNLFKDCLDSATSDVPFINIMMIGETGAGKSSFFNTVATALEDSSIIKDTYRVGSAESREMSVTKKVKLAFLRLRGKKPLAVRFYDIPGISKNKSLGIKELQMFINGEIKQGLEMTKNASELRKNEPFIRKNPTPKDQMHCILYVVKASSNLSTKVSPVVELMQDVRQLILEDDVRQFALVTHIDKVGVPKDDMVNALQYSCVYDICQKVSEVFQLPQSHVIPVSNYFDSEDPGDAKNAMALKAFWRIFKSGRDYIRENWGDENLFEGHDSSE